MYKKTAKLLHMNFELSYSNEDHQHWSEQKGMLTEKPLDCRSFSRPISRPISRLPTQIPGFPPFPVRNPSANHEPSLVVRKPFSNTITSSNMSV
jgi:hypothetical protein